MQTIFIENLTKRFGQFLALDNLNLTIGQGEVFCLLGQNGAGKTTTINILLGFIGASGGKVMLNGIAVKKNDLESKRYVAYIPEVMQLYGTLNGIENLEFFSRIAGFNYSKNELGDFLVKSGLQEEAHHKRLSAYSKGMRQKVGIAIALAKKAKIILMDEPTSGLDPKATDDFTIICKELAAEGRTVLMATHDIFNAVNVGTRIGIMKAGRLVHSVIPSGISAVELQKLYLETI
ncbi:ABC transporter ATP-binding protein [Ferruginibacter sp.]